MLVAGRAGDGQRRDFLARGAARAADGGEVQPPLFHRGHRVVLLGQAGQKVQVAFVRLVYVVHAGAGQRVVYARLQLVAAGDATHDLAQGLPVVAALGARAQLAPHFRAARPDGDGVGRAVVFHLVNFKRPFVVQRAAVPAQAQQQLGPLGGQVHAAVAVFNGQVQLVGLVAAALGQRQLHQARLHPVGNVPTIDNQGERRRAV